jgi:hypothetical protein
MFTIVNALLLLAILPLEFWRRWLRKLPHAPGWLPYATVLPLAGIATRVLLWGYCEVLCLGIRTLAEGQALAPRLASIGLVANAAAVGSWCVTAAALFGATCRSRWLPRRPERVTFGPYR